ncbi:MAG: ChbG/HpnK family deacetylase [Candidatus Nanoarchaeia archaeon]|nr:ChbG/HpnK family deacetylase [Candidatus Nanoarchaeia archaeon]
MKKLIVNADDFGYSDSVNKGIIDTHVNGIVTSTTMLVGLQGFNSAVKLAKKHKKLDIGIHLNLTEGKLANSLFDFLKKRFSRQEIEDELENQINTLEDTGLKLTHIDGHQHIHVFPKIFKIIVKLAKEHEIDYVRLPHEKLALNRVMFSSIFNGQFAKKIILSSLSINKRSLLTKNGLKTTDHFYGILSGKNLTYTKMAKVLKNVPEGITELVCHPGNENYSDYLDRVKERNILMHHNIKSLIKSLDIELTDFKSL